MPLKVGGWFFPRLMNSVLPAPVATCIDVLVGCPVVRTCLSAHATTDLEEDRQLSFTLGSTGGPPSLGPRPR